MEILSAPGGKYEMQPALRKVAALDEKGYLYVVRELVSRDSTLRTMLAEYRVRLEKDGFDYRQQPAKENEILAMYERVMGEKNAEEESSEAMRAARDLLNRAVDMGASDIHLVVNDELGKADIKMRINGDVELIDTISDKRAHSIAVALHDIWADSTEAKEATFNSRKVLSARIGRSAKLPEKLNGIRLESSGTFDGFHMVLRLLYDTVSEKERFQDLGFTNEQASVFDMLANTPSGMILVSGPTGSGKSTTINRYLRFYIRKTMGKKTVLTIEDPVEMPIPGAMQHEIPAARTDKERKAGFYNLMRNALRSDPDCILFGEIRDDVSAEMAMHAAMTGHQALATIHANNIIGAMDRLISMEVSPDLVYDASNVIGLVSQRLVRTLCDHCKVPLREAFADPEKLGLTHKDIERILRADVDIDKAFIKGHDDSCPHCKGTGISGREVVAEVMRTDDTLMQFLRDGRRIEAMKHIRNEMKVMTMLGHTVSKVNAGRVCPFDAERFVGNLDRDIIERDFKVEQDEVLRGHLA